MKLTVDTEIMQSVADRLSQLSEEYNSLHSSLLNKASTMGEAWKSPDNLAYVEQIQGFLDDFQNMTKHIEQCSQALHQQASNYQTICDENIASVKKLIN